GLRLQAVVQRSVFIIAVSEAAAIGEEIVGAMRLRPTSEIIECHHSHGGHNGAYKCHDGENPNVGLPSALFRHLIMRRNFPLFLHGELLPQSRRSISPSWWRAQTAFFPLQLTGTKTELEIPN